MELIMEQLPIVIKSLNIGFLQTLKLFFVTLVGAIPVSYTHLDVYKRQDNYI